MPFCEYHILFLVLQGYSSNVALNRVFVVWNMILFITGRAVSLQRPVLKQVPLEPIVAGTTYTQRLQIRHRELYTREFIEFFNIPIIYYHYYYLLMSYYAKNNTNIDTRIHILLNTECIS